jgi:hypothetical protein
VQFLYPLTVLYIGLLAFNVFGELAVAQYHMKSFGYQHSIQILPIRTYPPQQPHLTLIDFYQYIAGVDV